MKTLPCIDLAFNHFLMNDCTLNIFNMRLLIILLFWLFACGQSESIDSNTPDNPFFKAGIVMGYVQNPELDEISGIAASFQNPGCFWVHNDSGDEARIFLINSSGETIATVKLEGISNRDWEDIATGPGPVDGISYLYLAEIGDNNAKYSTKAVYRIQEPVVETHVLAQSLDISSIDVITFQYQDGNRDAETIMVDPLTKDLYIVSKRESNVQVYLLPYPHSVSETLVVQYSLVLPFTMATAGDISADGTEILIKNYQSIYYWKREADESIIDALGKGGVMLPYVGEQQGEAIAWLKNGNGYVTVSEKGKNKNFPALYFYERK